MPTLPDAKASPDPDPTPGTPTRRRSSGVTRAAEATNSNRTTAHSVPVSESLGARLAVSRSEPWRRASLLRAITRYISHYAAFRGRASRSEYWWIALIAAISLFITALVYSSYITSLNTITVCGNSYGCPPITDNERVVASYLGFIVTVGVIALAVIIPSLAITVRRLHDSNYSGHLLWLALIPILGPLTLHTLALTRPNPAGKRFDH